jgi:outer membrane protein assembly factor BamB
MYIINLLDCTVMYERGNNEPLKKRSWIAFDSAPLVDARTDTLIWPGECGLLYTFKLNTQYDKAAGTLSVTPEKPVMTRYSTNTGNTIGFESSAIIVENYIYIADNGSMLFCVDLNTMQLKWAQFVYDDTNATPCFEWGEDGEGYLYGASSMEFNEGTVYIYKINASTGEFVWKKSYEDVYFDESVSGGALSSPVLGKVGTEIGNMVIFSISRTPGYSSGVMVALDKATGNVIWEKSLNNYAWSSPVAVYGEDGTAHIILCDSGGRVHMYDSQTGEELSKISVGSNVEASPAVYKDMLVVGTRGQRVVGIKLS